MRKVRKFSVVIKLRPSVSIHARRRLTGHIPLAGGSTTLSTLRAKEGIFYSYFLLHPLCGERVD